MSSSLEAYRQFREREANAGILPVDELDGLLVAIVLTPEDIDTVEFMPLIWGEGAPDFADDGEEQAIFTSIFNRLVEIEIDLRDAGPVEPVFAGQGPDGGAQNWAKGFSRGMNLRPWVWEALIQDGDNMQLLAPIVAHLDDENGLPLPTATGRPIQEVRQEAAAIIPAALSALDLYFTMQKMQNVPPGSKRSRNKTGRNDPCPCGSGKKYKKCCIGRPN